MRRIRSSIDLDTDLALALLYELGAGDRYSGLAISTDCLYIVNCRIQIFRAMIKSPVC